MIKSYKHYVIVSVRAFSRLLGLTFSCRCVQWNDITVTAMPPSERVNVNLFCKSGPDLHVTIEKSFRAGSLSRPLLTLPVTSFIKMSQSDGDVHPAVDSTVVFKDDIFKNKVLFCTGGGSGICRVMTEAVVS